MSKSKTPTDRDEKPAPQFEDVLKRMLSSPPDPKRRVRTATKAANSPPNKDVK